MRRLNRTDALVGFYGHAVLSTTVSIVDRFSRDALNGASILKVNLVLPLPRSPQRQASASSESIARRLLWVVVNQQGGGEKYDAFRMHPVHTTVRPLHLCPRQIWSDQSYNWRSSCTRFIGGFPLFLANCVAVRYRCQLLRSWLTCFKSDFKCSLHRCDFQQNIRR